ncbi:extracellular solute-binding protein [Paenibacillus ginsengarvi]|uniref:Extracellular solute-binding protein n=1 Tax=Paenibacillus ginsengarvi TaxID=400777 RepID=A0A3B0CHU9_9BACL|nr:extracellular solute-binding protein [Paenibacillus ginsengarvi]RKN84461.1 extracellular solute-binding protein [Paenibacillus ginsengarvi]
MENRPGRHTSRLDELVQTLREEIGQGRRQPGEYLPSEREFSKQYGLSNLTVRKGLEQLVAEGLIVKIPRVGNKVIGPARESGPTLLNIGYYTSIPRETGIDRLLEKFHEQHPDIRVQAIPFTNEHPDVIKRFLDNGMLDVMTLNYNHFRAYLELGWADIMEPQQPDPDIYPYLTDAFTFEGELLVQPFIFSPVVLCYNRDHFREKRLHEPDGGWSWERLFDTASQLAIPNERLGFYYHFLSANRWSVLLLQRGGAFERKKEERIRLSGTEMMEAFRFCREVQEHFPILSDNINNGDVEHLFLQGKASIIMTSYFHLNFMMETPIRFDISPVPHFGNPATLLMSIGLAINSKSQNKEAARSLVRFLTSETAQLSIRQQTYSLPALKSAAEWVGEETIYRPSRFSLFREIVPSFRYFTDLGIGDMQFRTIEREVKLYFAGLESEDHFSGRLEELLSPVVASS